MRIVEKYEMRKKKKTQIIVTKGKKMRKKIMWDK